MQRQLLIVSVCFLIGIGSANADVNVSGTGTVTFQPDLANVFLTFKAEGKTTSATWKAHETTRLKLCDTLEGQGVKSKDIKTASVSISPRYEYPKQGKPQLLGYVVTAQLSATVRDVSKVTKILDQLTETKAEPQTSVVFTSTNLSELLDEARRKAVADAKHKATVFAQAAKATIGNVLAIEELRENLPRSGSFTYGNPGNNSAGVIPAEQQLSVSIRARYSLIPSP